MVLLFLAVFATFASAMGQQMVSLFESTSYFRQFTSWLGRLLNNFLVILNRLRTFRWCCALCPSPSEKLQSASIGRSCDSLVGRFTHFLVVSHVFHLFVHIYWENIFFDFKICIFIQVSSREASSSAGSSTNRVFTGARSAAWQRTVSCMTRSGRRWWYWELVSLICLFFVEEGCSWKKRY